MLALSRKQALFWLLILLSCLVALAISMTVISATNPGMWHQFMSVVPKVLNHM
jgi:hypothetical protein